MKKVVVSTFNNSDNNYGALFQSCALSTFLRNLGYDTYNVTILNRSKTRKNIKIKIKIFLKSFLLLPKRRIISARKMKFRTFAKETQNQIVYDNIQDLHKNPPIADAYISGSDQVWNPVVIHDDLFLSYVGNDVKKISYAASMGNEKIPPANEKKFAKYISEYDTISIREDSIAPIISKYIDKQIHQNVDPVFLLTRDEWHKLERPCERLKQDTFIFVYALEWFEVHNKKLLALKKETGLPVISVNSGNIKKMHADQVIYDASPNEFLYILNKASYVVTTSFHGAAMSIIYNKKFMALLNNDKPTRIESLFRYFNINTKNIGENLVLDIDYDRINLKIDQGVEEAREYLINSIEK